MGLHTDIPNRRQIEGLLQAGGKWLVSIYLPTSPITPEADAARIAFKNLAAEAVAGIHAGRAEFEAIEQALDDLHDDDDFWAEQAHSLSVFADPHRLRSFRLPNRLTAAVQ